MNVTKEAPAIVLTNHARKRSQSRGIPISSAILATRFGKKSRVPGNLFQRVFTKSCREKARKAGFAIQDIETAIGVPVICAKNELQEITVVSVLPKNKLRKKN